MLRGQKKRIEKLEAKAAPEEFEEIKIVNTIPGMFDKVGEFTIRYPKKRRRKR